MSYKDECPVCGSSHFEYSDTKVWEDCLVELCSCPECNSTWEEVWTFMANWNIKDGRKLGAEKSS